MGSIDVIHNVLRTSLLMSQLTEIPRRGASELEIRAEEALIEKRLCRDHFTILREFNGIGLDVIRVFGCGDDTGAIGRISSLQVRAPQSLSLAVAFGCDPSGFVYFQTPDGNVFSLDTDGGNVKQLAASFDDFFSRVVFGPDGGSFGGDDWLLELANAGLL